MKKSFLTAILMLCILLVLSACGSKAPSEVPAAEPDPTPAPALPTLESVLPGSNLTPAQAPEASPEAVVVDEVKLEAAKRCIDKNVSELYSAIGMPSDSSYAPSCLGPGEDGELYYEGFTVATYREGEKEIVREVKGNAG